MAAPARSASMHQNEPRWVWEMNPSNDENMEQRSNREPEPQPIAASRRAEGVTDARRDGFPAWLLVLAVAVVVLWAYRSPVPGNHSFRRTARSRRCAFRRVWALAPATRVAGTRTPPVPATITPTLTATPTLTPFPRTDHHADSHRHANAHTVVPWHPDQLPCQPHGHAYA